MKTVAIIQARMGSTRLPGKVMKTLCNKTVLGQVITRVKACQLLDEVVVATTHAPEDDILLTEIATYGAKSYRGSAENVLERYYFAAKTYQADIIIRITSDCPLFDPEVLTQMLQHFHKQTNPPVDYLSNSLIKTYPRGLDAEIFTFSALEYTYQHAEKPYELEHVTPYIYQHPEHFTLCNYPNATDLSIHRWTLDTVEDFILIEKIYTALYQDQAIFSTAQVLQLFAEKPELMQINAHIRQKQLGE